MSRRALTGLSKGKHRLSLGSPANRILEGVGGGQINLHAEKVSQAVFQRDHVDDRALHAVLVWRLLDEEKILQRDLPGYTEYMRRVRFRLVPFVW
jgi:hypothetical protein